MNDRNRDAASSTGRDTNSNDAHSLRCRLFIGNLATEKTSKAEVEKEFEKFGEIVSCSIHNNFGFVQFRDNKDADDAVQEMHGKILFGKRIDVNLAGLRRKPQSKDQYEGAPPKDNINPPTATKDAPSGRPPIRNRDRSPIRRESDSMYGRPVSPMSRYEELRKDDAYGRLGGYDRGPYDGYDRPREPARDFLGDRRMDPYPLDRRDDFLPPHERDYRETVGYRRSLEEPRPYGAPLRPAIDCEIVSLSAEETRYAEEVEGRLRSIGLVCNIGHPPSDLPILELMDRIARSGTLYAVVVSSTNAQHRSCTLNILHGTRQEHRNMPLDDALSFVARNFDSYLRVLRDPLLAPPVSVAPAYYPPREEIRPRLPPPSAAPILPNSEKEMSTDELGAMIERLKKEKEEREAAAAAAGKPPADQLREEPKPTNSYEYNNYAPPPAAPVQNPNGAVASEGYYSQPPQYSQPAYR